MLAYSITLLRRRLKFVVLAVVVSLACAAQVIIFVPPIQHSEASVLFVPSAKEPGVDEPTNPLLSLGGSVAIVASVVQVAVSDDQTATKLTDAGDSAEYLVVPDLGENAGPILNVTAEDPDPVVSQRTRDAVVQEITASLSALQNAQQVPATLRISTVVLTTTPEPTAIHKKQLQLTVIVFAGLMLASLGLILLLERRRRPGSREPSPPVVIKPPAVTPDREVARLPEAARPPRRPPARQESEKTPEPSVRR